MNRRRFTCLLALIGGALVIAPAASAQSTYSFKPLAMVPTIAGPGTISRPIGLSPDGSYASGEQQNQAAIEKGGNIKFLGFLSGSPYSLATGVAANGDAAVGWTGVGGFYWTPSAGITPLGVLPGYQNSLATDISEKGEAVIGYCSNSGPYSSFEAFLWSPSTGMQNLGFLPGHTFSYGTAISGSGLVATGYSGGFGLPITAVRWKSGQLQSLGTLPGYRDSFGYGISRYGDYIVGYVTRPGIPAAAFLWNRSTGMKSIAPLSGLEDSYLRDVSQNGDRSVGYGWFNRNSTTILYDNQFGKTYILQDLLLAKGITDVKGWQLKEATSISDDGTTIVGIGLNPRGRRMYWQATLP